MRTYIRQTAIPGLLGAALLCAAPATASGPGEFKFGESSYSAAEGGTVQVRVERSHGEDGAASVRVQSTGGSATAGADYDAVDVLLEWASGDGSDRFVAIALTDDAEAEATETIELALAEATGAGIDPTRADSLISISDNDTGGGGGGGGGGCEPGDDCGGGGGCEPGDDCGGGGGCEPGDDCGGGGGCEPGDDCGGGGGGAESPNGVFKFDERSFFTTESAGVAVITVERSHGEDGAVSVAYSASAGTAGAGDDFTEVSGTLSWDAGDGSIRSFTVPIAADDLAEPNETIELMLSSPTGGAVLDDERSLAVLTILDGGAGDDGAGGRGVLKFDEVSFEVIEGQTQAVIRVERSHGESGAVAVDFSTSDGSASAGDDYQAVSGTLSWGAGDGSVKTFAVPVFADDLSEGNESVNLHLSNPTGGATIDSARGNSILNILDDDGSTAPCEPGDDSGCAQGSRFSIDATFRTATGATGRGHMVPLSGNSVGVWFFSPDNLELLVKAIDACGFEAQPAYWLFYAATTNVDFTLRVTDTHTGIVKEYKNLLGQIAAPVQDTATFQTCGR